MGLAAFSLSSYAIETGPLQVVSPCGLNYVTAWGPQGSELFTWQLRLHRWIFQQVRWDLQYFTWSSLGIHTASLPHISSLFVEKSQNSIQFQEEETNDPSLHWRRVRVTLDGRWPPCLNNPACLAPFSFPFSPHCVMDSFMFCVMSSCAKMPACFTAVFPELFNKCFLNECMVSIGLWVSY